MPLELPVTTAHFPESDFAGSIAMARSQV